MTLNLIRAMRNKLGLPALTLVEWEPTVFDSYSAALRLCTDWELLASLTEQYNEDRRLTDNQKDALDVLANARDLAIRPSIQAATVHENTPVPDHRDGAS